MRSFFAEEKKDSIELNERRINIKVSNFKYLETFVPSFDEKIGKRVLLEGGNKVDDFVIAPQRLIDRFVLG